MTATQATRHDFTEAQCPHPDCRDPHGYQCANCGHYFPRTRVFMDDDSEPYCRTGMGCQARPAHTTPHRRGRDDD